MSVTQQGKNSETTIGLKMWVIEMGDGYKMFIIRGLYIKAKPDMTLNEFMKSDLLKTLVKERKQGIDRFKKDEKTIDKSSAQVL